MIDKRNLYADLDESKLLEVGDWTSDGHADVLNDYIVELANDYNAKLARVNELKRLATKLEQVYAR